MNRTVLKACLLGGALGDSVGLPSEGMNARRIARLRPGPLRQALVFGNIFFLLIVLTHGFRRVLPPY